MTHEQLIRTWFRRVWEEEDPAAIDEMMALATPVQGLGAHVNAGPEQFRAFHQGLLRLIGDVKIDIDRTTECGEWQHSLITVRARARETGTPIEFPVQTLTRLQDDRIVEGYNSIDFLSLFTQLGLLPKDTFETCFGGQRVG